MFSIFKAKPKLRELVPQNALDFHSHILYGLDDGAKSLEDTKNLIDRLIEIGFSSLTASPHTTPMVWENSREGILSQYEKIKSELPELTKTVNLRTVSEYLMDSSFIERFEREELLTLKERYVLVEMSYINPPVNLYEIIFKLISKGYKPILAHPERYLFFHNNKAEYDKLKDAGCKFQLNLLAATGYYGQKVADSAAYLLKENKYDYAATDVHHNKHINAFSDKVIVKHYQKIEQLIQNNSLFK